MILKKRKEEVDSIKKIGYYLTFVRGFWEAGVLISAICIFAPYVYFTGNTIGTEKAFPALVTLYCYRLHGNIFFSYGLQAFT